MKELIYQIDKEIIPNCLIYNRKFFNIFEINSDCIIRRYFVYTVDDKIKKVILESNHPNCDPTTGVFCIPNRLYNKKLTNEILDFIEKIFKTFNVDNCYRTLWNKFKYNNLIN